jgi:uncharacterized protein YbbK (DUF523 family)
MQKILMSACLLGAKVRYDGGDCEQQNALLNQWRAEGRIVTICPEMAGGLPTPRPPAEIIGQGGGEAVLNFQAKVVANTQQDVSDEFRKGAELALVLAQKHNIRVAIRLCFLAQKTTNRRHFIVIMLSFAPLKITPLVKKNA